MVRNLEEISGVEKIDGEAFMWASVYECLEGEHFIYLGGFTEIFPLSVAEAASLIHLLCKKVHHLCNEEEFQEFLDGLPSKETVAVSPSTLRTSSAGKGNPMAAETVTGVEAPGAISCEKSASKKTNSFRFWTSSIVTGLRERLRR